MPGSKPQRIKQTISKQVAEFFVGSDPEVRQQTLLLRVRWILMLTALLMLGVHLILYGYTRAWQLLVVAGIALVTLGSLWWVRRLIECEALDRAAYVILWGQFLAHTLGGVLLAGLTFHLVLGGGLLMLLLGLLLLPHHRGFWGVLALSFIFTVMALDAWSPLPRYDTSLLSLYTYLPPLATGTVAWIAVRQLFGLWVRLQEVRGELTQTQRAEQLLRRQLTELSVLHAVAAAGAAAVSEVALLQQVTQIIGEALRPDNFGILLIDPTDNTLHLNPSYRLGRPLPFERIPLGQGITGRVALDGRPRRVSQVTEAADYLPGYESTHSELCVPLKVGGQVIGVINIESDQPAAFTESDERLLLTLAGQLATAIDRLRTLATQQQRARQLTTIYEVGQRITSILSLDMLLAEVVEHLAKTLDFYNVEIALVEGDVLVCLAGYGGYINALAFDPGAPQALGEGISGRVAQTGVPWLVPDVHQEPGYLAYDFLPEVQAELAVPLRIKEKVIGVLDVKSDRVGGIAPTDAAMLEILADQVAIAIENARLYQSAVAASKQQEILHWASQEIVSASLDPERVCQAIHEATSQLMPSEAFVIGLLDELTDEVEFLYLVDKGQRLPSRRVPAEGTLSRIVIQGRRSLRIDDLEQADVNGRHFGDEERVRAFVAVPLRHGDQILGMLSAQSYTPGVYTANDEHLLEMLAAPAGVALENARLFTAERQRRAELEALQQASLNLTASLELEAVLEAILSNALKLVRADDAHVFHYDGRRLHFGAVLWAGEHDPAQSPYLEPRQDGLTYQVARSGERIVVPDVDQHPLFADYRWGGAIAGFPLRIGNEVRGVMNIAFKQPHRFDEHEIRVLTLLGDQAALVLENARLFEATRRQLRELSILHQVAISGTEAISEDVLIERATDIIANAFYPDHFGVLLVDTYAGVLCFHPSYRGLPEGYIARVIPLGQGVTGRVAVTGTPERIGDVAQDAAYISVTAEMRSEVCVPLKIGQRIIGVLNAESSEPDAFTAEDERLLTTFAGQLATAIEKVRLLEETQEALLREQHLNEVARTISSTLDLEVVLPNVLRLAAQLVSADAGVLLLLGKDGVPQYRYFNLPPNVGLTPEDRGVLYQCAQEGESALLMEYAAHPQALQKVVRAGVLGLVAAPIVAGKNAIGALGLLSADPRRRFSERDLALIQAIGLQAGVAIQNANLFAEAQERATELARALAQLKELDRLKSQFIQNVSHELRTPLAIIMGYAELLNTGELGALAPLQVDPISIITRRSQMLRQLVEDLTTILEAESGKMELEPVDLGALVEMQMQDYRATADGNGVQLVVEVASSAAPLRVRGDMAHLRRVLDNLVGNALKFTPPEGTITVRLTPQAEQLCLEVGDTGIGIPEEQQLLIFERFYQVDGSMSRRYGGTGLGLALVKEIAEAHGGSVTVQSKVGEGSIFRVLLPALPASEP